jgi:hypothetical protein
MAEKNESGSTPEPLSEERFRYIGFNVYSGSAPEFWKDDSERQSHLAHVRESGGRFVPLSRSNSLVAARSISAPERWMLTLSSALMAVSPLLPWFTFTRGTEKLSYSGLSLILNAGVVREYFALGPGILNASFMLLLVLMLASSALGIAALWFLYSGGTQVSDAYLSRLHKIMTWHYLPIVGWAVFFGLTAPSTELPYGVSLGLSEVGDHLSLGTLTSASSAGLWIPFGALWVNAVKGNDL